MADKLTVEHFERATGFRPRQRLLEVKDKKPDRNYRLVSNNPDKIEYWKELGFEVETAGEGAQSSSKGQPDQRQVVAGAYVLMSRPMELAEAHRTALDKRALTRMAGPREAFKSMAAKHGVETEDHTRMRVGPLSAGLEQEKD
jgi:hypothetical protein